MDCVCYAGPYRKGDRCTVCGRVVGVDDPDDLLEHATGDVGPPTGPAPLTDEYLFGPEP
jgi:hypothetical protein